MVIDREGVIRDVAFSNEGVTNFGIGDLVERRWVDTVTVESRPKVEEMLRDALNQRESRRREVNQQSPRGSIPFRYVAVDAGRDGRVIALGHDLRAVETLQQQLLQAQQAMERDYVRLRQAEVALSGSLSNRVRGRIDRRPIVEEDRRSQPGRRARSWVSITPFWRPTPLQSCFIRNPATRRYRC